MSIKQAMVCCIVVIVAVCWAGCGQPTDELTGQAGMADNTLPDFVVGTWQPSDSRWILTLEADGTVSRMRHFIGVDFVVAEGGVVEPWLKGAEAMYILGPCAAKYDRDSGELTVEVNIDEYIITFPNGTMEGSFHDKLTGRVNQEKKLWEVTWTSTADMVGDSQAQPKSKPKPMVEKLIFSQVGDDVYGN
jgi:hypothetical protein